MAHTGKMYAVAFRDSGKLYLYLRIHRNPRGEVFVVVNLADRKAAIHASYHEDGRAHLKSYGGASFMRRQGPPINTFTGNFPLWGSSLSSTTRFAGECNSEGFDEVFEIGRENLTGNHIVHSSNLEVYLVEPDTVPPTYPSSTIVKSRHFFKDRTPWIVVTLYDFAWLRQRHGISQHAP